MRAPGGATSTTQYHVRASQAHSTASLAARARGARYARGIRCAHGDAAEPADQRRDAPAVATCGRAQGRLNPNEGTKGVNHTSQQGNTSCWLSATYTRPGYVLCAVQPISDEQRIPSIAEDTHIFLASEGSPFGCCSPCCRPCQASCGPSQATCRGHPTTLGGDPPRLGYATDRALPSPNAGGASGAGTLAAGRAAHAPAPHPRPPPEPAGRGGLDCWRAWPRCLEQPAAPPCAERGACGAGCRAPAVRPPPCPCTRT